MSYHVRSCTFVTYLMVLFLWSCDLSLAISRMDFVVSVIAYLGCDWLSPLSVQDSTSLKSKLCYYVLLSLTDTVLPPTLGPKLNYADLRFRSPILLVTYLARAAPA